MGSLYLTFTFSPLPTILQVPALESWHQESLYPSRAWGQVVGVNALCSLQCFVTGDRKDTGLWKACSDCPQPSPTWSNSTAVWLIYLCHHNHFMALFQDNAGEPVPEENFWTLWCKGRFTEADTPTIWLGATPSGLTSAHLHHPPFFTGRMPFLPPNHQCHWATCA